MVTNLSLAALQVAAIKNAAKSEADFSAEHERIAGVKASGEQLDDKHWHAHHSLRERFRMAKALVDALHAPGIDQ